MKHQKGFSLVETFVIVLVMVLLGGIGWYALQKNGSKDNSQKTGQSAGVTMISYTDSSKTFSFQYPNTWTIVPYEAPGHDNPNAKEPDWTKTTQPITLRNQTNPNAKVIINGFPDAGTTINKEMASLTQDQFNDHTMLTIHGAEAMKHVVDFVGPSDAEKYKDTTYILVSKGRKVTVQFRERYSNATLGGQNDFDAAAQSSDFDKIANSVTFLQ